MKTVQRSYFRMDTALVDYILPRLNLSSTDRYLLLLIYRYSYGFGKPYTERPLQRKYLAHKAGCSESTVKRALDTFKSMGIISRRTKIAHPKYGSGNTYNVIPYEQLEQRVTVTPGQRVTVTPYNNINKGTPNKTLTKSDRDYLVGMFLRNTKQQYDENLNSELQYVIMELSEYYTYEQLLRAFKFIRTKRIQRPKDVIFRMGELLHDYEEHIATLTTVKSDPDTSKRFAPREMHRQLISDSFVSFVYDTIESGKLSDQAQTILRGKTTAEEKETAMLSVARLMYENHPYRVKQYLRSAMLGLHYGDEEQVKQMVEAHIDKVLYYNQGSLEI